MTNIIDLGPGRDYANSQQKLKTDKPQMRNAVRRDIVDHFLTDMRPEFDKETIKKYIKRLDTHRGSVHGSSTNSRKVVDRACDAALLMRNEAGKPFSFKTRMDLSVFISRVVAGEFYADNDLRAGSGFLGSGAIDIMGLNSSQVMDIKNLFIMEGEKRISSHKTADLKLTNELIGKQRSKNPYSYSYQMKRRYGSILTPQSSDATKPGDVLAFNIPPTITNPESGEQFKHVMLFNIFSDSQRGYTVRIKPEAHGWEVRGTSTSDKIHHTFGFIGTVCSSSASDNYYSEKKKNKKGPYKVEAGNFQRRLRS